jgi:hypothetical protein
MGDNTLMNLIRRMQGETTTTCDQCGKSYVGPNDTPLFVGLRDTGIGEDMLQAFCSWECAAVGSLHGPAASWFATRPGPPAITTRKTKGRATTAGEARTPCSGNWPAERARLLQRCVSKCTWPLRATLHRCCKR